MGGRKKQRRGARASTRSARGSPAEAPRAAHAPGDGSTARTRWLLFGLLGLALAGALAAILLGTRAGGEVAPAPVEPAAAPDLDPEVLGRLEELLAAARADPGTAAAHVELGLLYEANELWDEAERSFANAVALEAADPLLRYHRALCLRQAGDFEGALAALRAVVRAAPGLPAAQQRLGDWLLDDGDVDGAERAYQSALAVVGDSPECHAGLADVCIARRDYEGARELAQKALAAAPDYRLARYHLGRAYRGLDRRAEAERELGRGLGAQRRNLADPLSLRLDEYRLNLAARINEAADWIEAGQPARAVALLEGVHERDPENLDVLNNLAAALQELGRLEDAERLFLSATELDPAAFAGFLNLANCLLAGGRTVGALQPAERAAALAPELAPAHFVHGRVLAALGRHDEALVALDSAARLDPRNGQADVARAEIRVEQGRLEEAAELYEAAVGKEPDFLPAHVNRGLLYLRLGRLEAASSAAAAARAIDPDHPWLAQLEARLAEARRP